ncbi:MAG: CAP domain-containing protein, partial [Pyrinomonadaceae bacterium]
KVDDRADQFGLNDWRRIGENIAWVMGHADPAVRVVECWMRSPGHRNNILDSNFREAGLGLAVANDGKYYFTQVFVKRK